MPRSRSTGAIWALLGWSVLIVVGFLLQNGPDSEGSREAAEVRQEVALLEERKQVRRLQKELVGALRNVMPVYVPVPGLLDSRDLSPRRRSALLNLGRDDGMSEGLGVVAASGLVGRIVEVHDRYSWVMLADDTEFRVLFHPRGRDAQAIAQGEGEPRRLRSSYRDGSVPFQLDETVLTQGGDGVFPRGIVVGKIVGTDPTRRQATIELPHDPDRVRVVAVLTLPQNVSEQRR